MIAVAIKAAPYAAAAVAGALLTFGPVYLTGKSAGRAERDATAAKTALERIEQLDRNNEAFKRGSDRDRCVIFMRDSRLPVSNCD